MREVKNYELKTSCFSGWFSRGNYKYSKWKRKKTQFCLKMSDQDSSENMHLNEFYKAFTLTLCWVLPGVASLCVTSHLRVCSLHSLLSWLDHLHIYSLLNGFLRMLIFNNLYIFMTQNRFQNWNVSVSVIIKKW